MDNNSEIAPLSYSESISALTTGVAKGHNGNVPTEEVSLLRHLQRGISETTEENAVFTKEVTSFLSKLNLEIKEQKIIKEKRQQREENQMSLIYDKLLKNSTKLQTKLDHLHSAVDTLKDTIDETEKDRDSLYCNKVFLSTKLKEYEQAVEKLEADLSGMQVDEQYPEKILDKYNLYLERKSKLANLNQSLAQYGELPPNLFQAELLVESKKKEYENLEQLFLEETH
ncbi:hypothetical protein X777_13964 [Ooceraea biroi]|uniref:Uncharacterized protein n=1 Tax=Ooceraea biroi TaxID=2015173 RepID=A0A026X002_OOCBI|nr:hypothetical protein X777_13964 [Ooceraea biroi]